ncbi:nitrilase family protein [Porphyromonas loveana]|uniref:nitrilase family protein n=1 Tax=Porphyromonas loveana TaxID=1884669 RepID=UPI00359F6F3F
MTIQTDIPRLRIAMAQCRIDWEDKHANLQRVERLAAEMAGTTDVLFFPEMMTTGFSMNVQSFAEPFEEGETITVVRRIAAQYNMALSATMAVSEAGKFYNRAYFVTPQGEVFHQDKRHLFRVGGEHEVMTPAEERRIITYKGWKIFIIPCYDLRFPVWCANTDLEYDLLVCMANWPEPRRTVWQTLLRARAMENYAYVCGVNRVGEDGIGLHYTGDSVILSPRGEVMQACTPELEETLCATLDKESMHRFREKFPAWMDMDRFTLDYEDYARS